MKKPDVLVLNKSWLPINVVDWERAMCLLAQNSVKALDRDLNPYNFEKWIEFSEKVDNYPFVKTVNKNIAVPEVLVSNTFNKYPKVRCTYGKSKVIIRDNYTCAFCKKKFEKYQLTVDHIHPKSRGGKSTWTNTITACKKCNAKKGCKTLEESGLKLHFQPSIPKWTGVTDTLNIKRSLQSWKHFLNVNPV